MTIDMMHHRPGAGAAGVHRREFSLWRRTANGLKTAVLLAALGGLFVGIGSLFGRGGALFGLLVGLAVVGASYWFSDDIAIRAAGAVPVGEWEMPQYYRIVRELCATSGLPMPRLYVTPDRQPNAFATGRDPHHAAVAVTRGILDVLSWEELKGVLAHELSHIGNRDILISSVAAAVATAISFLGHWLMWLPFLGGGPEHDDGPSPLGIMVAALVAPLAAGLLQMALSRSREFEADASGARLIGDGRPLASALAKLERSARLVPMDVDPAQSAKYIVNPLTGRRVDFASLFTTHPSTDERVRRLLSGEWAG
jgi:heat shock protein HtpX